MGRRRNDRSCGEDGSYYKELFGMPVEWAMRNLCRLGLHSKPLARKHYPQPFDKGCNILAVLPDRHGRLVDADDLGSRCRPVKNFEHEEMLVLGLGPLKCAKTIVPATKDEAE